MNIAFWLLILIIAVILWFVLAFLFKPIGRVFARLYSDAVREMTDEEKKDNEKEI